MNVDISPNLPPRSSCTTAAPAGSGDDGGGSSVWMRSRRRIMARLLGRTSSCLGAGPSLGRGSVNIAGVSSDRDPAEVLRERGLRVTPQRRAILGAFSGGPHEHLAADEIHARAATAVPELGRGTVYATLAELTEAGILAAHGSPDPVRYETNTAPHQHFRCRLCLRLFDIELAEPAVLRSRGFEVEELTVTARGICADCVAYDRGLRAAARRARGRPSSDLPGGLAAVSVETAVGPLTVAATARGVVRSVWE